MYATVVRSNSVAQDEKEGVRIPYWFFYMALGATVGVLLGPTIWAATDAGRHALAKVVRERIER